MPKILAVAFFVLAIVALASCAQNSSSSSAQAHKELTVDEIKERLKVNPKAKLVDVRTEAEYKQGHIEGAIVLPLSQVKAPFSSETRRSFSTATTVPWAPTPPRFSRKWATPTSPT